MTQYNQPTKSNKTLIYIIVGIVVALLIIGASIWGITQLLSGQKKQQENQRQDSNNPNNIDGIAVGPFRYVNACRALSAETVNTKIAGQAKASLVEAVAAEDGLPISKITVDNPVVSSCSRQLGSNTPYQGASFMIKISQYVSKADTAKAYKQYEVVSAEEQQKKNEEQSKFGLKQTSPTVNVDGVPNTTYTPNPYGAVGTSHTLVDNAIVELSVSSLDTSPEAKFKEDIKVVLPIIIANIKDPKLSQKPIISTAYGKKIGESTYVNPCDVFTATDFSNMLKVAPDPTQVKLSFNTGATLYQRDDISVGEADSQCSRQTYHSESSYRNADVDIEYFKSAGDASRILNERFGEDATDETATTNKAQGMGDFAYTQVPKKAGSYSSSRIYVQKGPYILAIKLFASSNNKATNISPDELSAFAKSLLPKLP